MDSLTERKHTGKWGVLTAAEKRAQIEGGSAIAVIGASKTLKTVQVRFLIFKGIKMLIVYQMFSASPIVK